MLEKIGLPPKPSLRGNNWVIDATHCQGCSSQFTILFRKHHCRRCGGIFCGTCTQQRLYLRGQGESPVRICEPCKALEEAARFELRHGHKNKSRKGAKLASDNEDDTSTKSKGDNGNELNPSSSFSNSEMEVDLESTTPEELRQQAVEEKKKYKVLKAEGKPEEALRAFKRGKELERQAGTLEIELRKNHRKALSSTSTNEKSKGENGKKQKDDLASELVELGWSDHDLHDTEKKPVNMTLEGELLSLIKESSHKSTKTEKGSIGIDKSEVLAIKRHALVLKREGKLPEAKEELKRAKILEKQIEERELLGDDSDSDDEFASLIRSMDIDKQDILSSGVDRNRNVDFDFDFDHLPENLEVTDDDINDPEMSAALQSLGWVDDGDDDMDDDVTVSTQIQILKKEALVKKRAGNNAEALELLKKARMLEKGEKGEKDETGGSLRPDPDHKTGRKSKLVIQRELLSLKKKALALRREGKTDEADQELAKGKVLEQQLEELETGPKVKPAVKPVDFSMGEDEPEDVTDTDMNDPSYLSVLQNLGWQDEEPKSQPKSQTMNVDVAEEQKGQPEKPKSQTVAEEPKSQTESNSVKDRIMAHKRKAVMLKREGKLAEAKEELKLAKLLENAGPSDKVSISTPGPVGPSDNVSISTPGPVGPLDKVSISTPGPVDPSDKVSISTPGQVGPKDPKPMEEIEDSPPVKLSSRERFKIQQESLSHKRKALKLRREGRNEEAEAEFELAKNLESRLEAASEALKPAVTGGDDVAGVEDLLDPQLLFALREVGIEGGGGGGGGGLLPEKVEVVKGKAVAEKSERVEIEEEIKAEKVKAVKLKRAGKQAEALEAFRRAKLLEKKLNSLT